MLKLRVGRKPIGPSYSLLVSLVTHWASNTSNNLQFLGLAFRDQLSPLHYKFKPESHNNWLTNLKSLVKTPRRSLYCDQETFVP